MKGIILAGGAGTRLYPLTRVVCKQLLPVYDKPMIYYPLSTLMLGGIQEICLISTPKDTPIFKDFLGDGSQFGVHLEYIVQDKPEGIAQAFLLAEKFIGNDAVTLILGDNIFYGHIGHTKAIEEHHTGATIFGYPVKDPRPFGVIEFDKDGKAISIEEKPAKPKSNYIVPGLYVYDNTVVDITKNLQPSPRGELEITDVNSTYLKKGQLKVIPIGRGAAWLDSGTTHALAEASTFIEIVEERQGLKIGCPEEVALRKGFLSLQEFEALCAALPRCQYSEYLEKVAEEFAEHGVVPLGEHASVMPEAGSPASGRAAIEPGSRDPLTIS